MIQVDFYSLNSADEPHYWLFVCELIERLYFQKERIFIYCNHQTDAETLDDHLWSFKEESFIPHNIQGEGPNSPPPVQIGFEDKTVPFNQTLINLADTIPTMHKRFKRIIEIVKTEETHKEILRDHYRYYQAQGFQLNHKKGD